MVSAGIGSIDKHRIAILEPNVLEPIDELLRNALLNTIGIGAVALELATSKVIGCSYRCVLALVPEVIAVLEPHGFTNIKQLMIQSLTRPLLSN